MGLPEDKYTDDTTTHADSLFQTYCTKYADELHAFPMSNCGMLQVICLEGL